MTTFVVVLTAFLGLASIKPLVFKCTDVVCVADLENHAEENANILRFEVWRTSEFAPLPVSGRPVWPPIIDERYL